MISAILIYGQRGETLVSRIYKDGLRRAVTDAFRAQVILSSEVQAPLLTMGSTSFLHIKYNNMLVVAVTRHDVDGIAVFELLWRFCEVCNKQLGRFDEAACYRHVSQIYEILDEIVDFGYPQNAEYGLMRLSGSHADSMGSSTDSGSGHTNGSRSVSSGTSGGHGIGSAVSSLKRSFTSAKPASSSSSSLPTSSGNGAIMAGTSHRPSAPAAEVPWRRSDVKHRRNEIYLDVMEKLNMVFEPDGHLISASTDGVLRVKAQLSGLPHCQVDLDRMTVLENSQLHACVDHGRFHDDGVVQFVPPEGEFDLLRYRVSKGIKVPLVVQNGTNNGEYFVRIKCTLESRRHLTNVALLVPLPPSSTSSTQRLKSSSGKAKFTGESTAVEWKIARLAGNSEATLRISSDEFATLSGNGPITVKFLVNMFTSSSLHVESLRVAEESKYSTLKWVRYLTESGACEART